MKRFWTAVAVSIFAICVFAGCGNNNTSIQNPTGATITTVSPSGVIFGSQATTITVIASQFNGFLTTTVIEVNQQKIPTTYLDGITLTGVVPASLLAKSSTLSVQTLTPQSGAGMNGLSNSLSFLVYGSPNPVPVLTSISPTSAALCTSTSNCASVNITLTGSNFLPSSTNGNSKVTFTGAATNQIETAINTSSISATQIVATIPGKYLMTADSAKINVLNPPSGICLVNCPDLGGGDSLTPQTFTIGSGAAAAATSAVATGEETPAVSQDGRYVAYAAEQNQISQILFRDTCVGAEGCTPSTKTISQTLDGTAGNADSHSPVMSADGRFVAFSSVASNFVEGAPAGRQIYLHDTCIGAVADCKESIALVSTDASGALTGTEAILPSISTTGRFVAFVAVTKSNAGPGKAAHAASGTANSGLRQVFVRDTCLATANCTAKTTRITTEPGDAEDLAKPAGPALSGEAKQVALANGKNATVLTTTVPVDDSVFLAATGAHK
jgi:WD40-like Beta Propeller Repeat